MNNTEAKRARAAAAHSVPGGIGSHRRGTAVIVALLMGVWLYPKPLPATVAEQRERLPPAAFCDDPVTGDWRSHQYNPLFQDWEEFTLSIRRVEGSETALVGGIQNHSWRGTEEQELPGPCRGELHFDVSMDAQGDVRDGSIRFGGVGAWRLDALLCGGGNFGYNLDNFSGQIDPERQEFQSVNNDGGRAVDAPTVFRRIRCLEPPAPDQISVDTPAFFPTSERSSGCSASCSTGVRPHHPEARP